MKATITFTRAELLQLISAGGNIEAGELNDAQFYTDKDVMKFSGPKREAFRRAMRKLRDAIAKAEGSHR
jgi:hypothetical protein